MFTSLMVSNLWILPEINISFLTMLSGAMMRMAADRSLRLSNVEILKAETLSFYYRIVLSTSIIGLIILGLDAPVLYIIYSLSLLTQIDGIEIFGRIAT